MYGLGPRSRFQLGRFLLPLMVGSGFIKYRGRFSHQLGAIELFDDIIIRFHSQRLAGVIFVKIVLLYNQNMY